MAWFVLPGTLTRSCHLAKKCPPRQFGKQDVLAAAKAQEIFIICLGGRIGHSVRPGCWTSAANIRHAEVSKDKELGFQSPNQRELQVLAGGYVLLISARPEKG